MDRKALLDKANTLQGCLSHLQTTKGRRKDTTRPEGEALILPNPFEADESKLLSSKAFRLLRNKTQVVTVSKNPFVRNRQTHVLEVVAISVIASEVLGLNTSLVRAIAIGHDIGHVPLGHQGESFMAKAMGRPEFCHEIMGPIVAQKIERKGVGLNLTFEVLEGMMCHSGAKAREGMTQEAWLVRFTDKFAYIFADYNDLITRMRYPARQELHKVMDEFGSNQRQRTQTAMAGLVVESAECGKVSFEHSEVAQKFKRLRELMYEIYPHVTQQNSSDTMTPVINFLREINIGDPFLLLALMTDNDVLELAKVQVPNYEHLKDSALGELIPYMETISPPNNPIDLCNPYLDW